MSEFSGLVEQDFEFPDSVAEKGRELGTDEEADDRPEMEDRSLGEAYVALSEKWVRKQLTDPAGYPTRISRKGTLPWGDLWEVPEEGEPERIKGVVSPKDFDEVEVAPGKKFFMGKTLSPREKEEYGALLSGFADVFAWATTDLRGIPL